MIHLKEIDQSNYRACIALQPAASQKDFVSPNWYSLLESIFEEQRQAFAIYHEDVMVGFILFSYYTADEEYPKDSWWIERFMIGQDFQQQGFGRQAMAVAISWFNEQVQAQELRISSVFENKIAETLYEKMGFVKTGEQVNGETVLLRKFDL
ncbi:diamine N-acetyltransferase [Enterococcus sp. DIV0876]